ncbi:dTDP-4-dehydrorhamnose reductase [Chryseobacterium sp. 09-1422]|uniref:dTDP-4-dehydrorhamnose reductase n=1 Tax=Chryseobacterium kimseyorum TaxID=2984028 RepID=A0ABT3I385_9FLAO|nr:dTDP-4-dehydrorhamnose reductase [Chryseobacterium kimseyorum]MCW3170519.1 dTDP-4-dehydrorhamnose reductase [Chryseobacterium kimseyorum]
MKILVTGANGQLGSEIKVLSDAYPNDSFIFVDKDLMPLDNLEEVRKVLDFEKPQVIISAGAYTAVDLAESEVELVDTINHLSVAVMAEWTLRNQAKLIHISTDYVFDGNQEEPLTEEQPTDPVNFYGLSKLRGEIAITQSGADAVVIRTAWVYSSFGANFVKTMIRLMCERDEINVISDQVGSPTYARDLAQVILDIIHSQKWENGIYHYSNEGKISWYDFAVEIKRLKKLDCNINAIPTVQYPTPAKRPKFSLLDKTKIKKQFEVVVPDWKSSLIEMLNKEKTTT